MQGLISPRKKCLDKLQDVEADPAHHAADVPERIYGAYSATGRQCTGRRRAANTGHPMRIYLNAVQHYARVHPDFNGTVDESALALPSWFLKSWNMGHVLASSRVYVY